MTTVHYDLNRLADRIERAMAQYGAPAAVTGGAVGPRTIRFDLVPAAGIRAAAIRRLSEELALAVGVRDVAVRRTPRGMALEFPRPDPRAVRLLDLLTRAEPLPSATALLGLSDDDLPLLARLSSPDVAHILIAGTTGSGKSVLLRTIAASLVLSHSPDALRLLCLDPKASAFSAFEGIPHLLRPPVSDPAEIAQVLASLERLMELRASPEPRVVVAIDELSDIIMTVGRATETLTRLAQRGREAGLHLVAAAQRPSAAILSGLMRANFPLRLVGRVVSSDDARIAAGRHGTAAHTLAGRGDFLAVTGHGILRFTAAYIDHAELYAHLADWRAEPPAPDLLPELEPDPERVAAPDQVASLAARLAPWWAANGGGWGSKSAACKHLFGPSVRYAGYHARLTDAAIARVEGLTDGGSLLLPPRGHIEPVSTAPSVSLPR